MSKPGSHTRTIERLIETAIQAQKRAYCPYSRYPVGAAVLTESGRVFPGCNVENASYGLSMCAERAAIYHAVASGHDKLKAAAFRCPVWGGTVGNLSAGGANANSVTLSFSEVSDGAGQPATYNIRFSSNGALWGEAPSVTQGTCATPLVGTTVGATKTCTVLGLSPATAYQFQLVPYRGTLGAGAVFGALSNVAGATTSAATDVMPPNKPKNMRVQ